MRRELLQALAQLCLALHHLVTARGARAVVGGQGVDEAAQDRRGIADEPDRRLTHALRLLGVEIDADDREVVVDAPVLHV